MKIIEENNVLLLWTCTPCVFDVVENATLHFCFLIAPDKSSKEMSKVGYYLLPHSSHSYPNFRRSKQILTYIYKSNLVFYDFTIFVTHGCYSGSGVVVATNGKKANEEQQMTKFPVNKRILMLQPSEKNEETFN
jgi:hypothetical protein